VFSLVVSTRIFWTDCGTASDIVSRFRACNAAQHAVAS
jgi:hypothetical protein